MNNRGGPPPLFPWSTCVPGPHSSMTSAPRFPYNVPGGHSPAYGYSPGGIVHGPTRYEGHATSPPMGIRTHATSPPRVHSNRHEYAKSPERYSRYSSASSPRRRFDDDDVIPENDSVVVNAGFSFRMGKENSVIHKHVDVQPAHTNPETPSSGLTRQIDKFLKKSDHTLDRYQNVVQSRSGGRMGVRGHRDKSMTPGGGRDISPDTSSMGLSYRSQRSTSAASIAVKAAKHLESLSRVKSGEKGKKRSTTAAPIAEHEEDQLDNDLSDTDSSSLDGFDTDDDVPRSTDVFDISDDTSADLSKLSAIEVDPTTNCSTPFDPSRLDDLSSDSDDEYFDVVPLPGLRPQPSPAQSPPPTSPIPEQQQPKPLQGNALQEHQFLPPTHSKSMPAVNKGIPPAKMGNAQLQYPNTTADSKQPGNTTHVTHKNSAESYNIADAINKLAPPSSSSKSKAETSQKGENRFKVQSAYKSAESTYRSGFRSKDEGTTRMQNASNSESNQSGFRSKDEGTTRMQNASNSESNRSGFRSKDEGTTRMQNASNSESNRPRPRPMSPRKIGEKSRSPNTSEFENSPKAGVTLKREIASKTENTPKADITPKLEILLKAESEPEAKNASKSENTPNAGDTPKIGSTPQAEDKPKAGWTPKVEGTPKAEAGAKIDSTPKAGNKEKVEDIPKVESTQNAENTFKTTNVSQKAENTPKVDNTPHLDNTSKTQSTPTAEDKCQGESTLHTQKTLKDESAPKTVNLFEVENTSKVGKTAAGKQENTPREEKSAIGKPKNKPKEEKSGTGKPDNEPNEKTALGKPENTLNEKTALGKPENTPNEKTALGKPENTPNEKTALGKPENTPNEKTALGKPENTPNEKTALGKPENTPNEKTALGKPENTPNEKTGIGKPEKTALRKPENTPNEKTALGKPENTPKKEKTAKSENTSNEKAATVKPENTPKVEVVPTLEITSKVEGKAATMLTANKKEKGNTGKVEDESKSKLDNVLEVESLKAKTTETEIKSNAKDPRKSSNAENISVGILVPEAPQPVDKTQEQIAKSAPKDESKVISNQEQMAKAADVVKLEDGVKPQKDAPQQAPASPSSLNKLDLSVRSKEGKAQNTKPQSSLPSETSKKDEAAASVPKTSNVPVSQEPAGQSKKKSDKETVNAAKVEDAVKDSTKGSMIAVTKPEKSRFSKFSKESKAVSSPETPTVQSTHSSISKDPLPAPTFSQISTESSVSNNKKVSSDSSVSNDDTGKNALASPDSSTNKETTDNSPSATISVKTNEKSTTQKSTESTLQSAPVNRKVRAGSPVPSKNAIVGVKITSPVVTGKLQITPSSGPGPPVSENEPSTSVTAEYEAQTAKMNESDDAKLPQKITDIPANKITAPDANKKEEKDDAKSNSMNGHLGDTKKEEPINPNIANGVLTNSELVKTSKNKLQSTLSDKAIPQIPKNGEKITTENGIIDDLNDTDDFDNDFSELETYFDRSRCSSVCSDTSRTISPDGSTRGGTKRIRSEKLAAMKNLWENEELSQRSERSKPRPSSGKPKVGKISGLKDMFEAGKASEKPDPLSSPNLVKLKSPSSSALVDPKAIIPPKKTVPGASGIASMNAAKFGGTSKFKKPLEVSPSEGDKILKRERSTLSKKDGKANNQSKKSDSNQKEEVNVASPDKEKVTEVKEEAGNKNDVKKEDSVNDGKNKEEYVKGVESEKLEKDKKDPQKPSDENVSDSKDGKSTKDLQSQGPTIVKDDKTTDEKVVNGTVATVETSQSEESGSKDTKKKKKEKNNETPDVKDKDQVDGSHVKGDKGMNENKSSTDTALIDKQPAADEVKEKTDKVEIPKSESKTTESKPEENIKTLVAKNKVGKGGTVDQVASSTDERNNEVNITESRFMGSRKLGGIKSFIESVAKGGKTLEDKLSKTVIPLGKKSKTEGQKESPTLDSRTKKMLRLTIPSDVTVPVGSNNVPGSGSSIAPSSGSSIAPSSGSSIAPSSGSSIAPSSGSSIAPSSGSSIALTSGPSIVPTSGPSIALTSGPSIVPTSGPSIVPTSGSSIVPNSGSSIAPSSGSNIASTSESNIVRNSGSSNVPSSVAAETIGLNTTEILGKSKWEYKQSLVKAVPALESEVEALIKEASVLLVPGKASRVPSYLHPRLSLPIKPLHSVASFPDAPIGDMCILSLPASPTEEKKSFDFGDKHRVLSLPASPTREVHFHFEETSEEEEVFVDAIDPAQLDTLMPLPDVQSERDIRSRSRTPMDIRERSITPSPVVAESEAILSETDRILRRSRSNKSLRRSYSRTLSSAALNRLSEVTADLSEEHTTSHLAGERLEAEQTERMKLEKEIDRLQTDNKRMTSANGKLEMEKLALRSEVLSAAELNGDLDDDEAADASLYKRKYEWCLREIELLKKQAKQQQEDDLDQLLLLRKQLEKKVADAYEETDEQRQVVAQLKRKSQRLQAEMNDLKILLEEQTSRNNLLEKKQRKFDQEMMSAQEELRHERSNKDKIQRERDQILSEKYSFEQEVTTLKLELELKEEKVLAINRELDDLTSSGKVEEEVATLKKAKHDLELRIKDQEEELDDLAGQVQMLEGAKVRLEMGMEQMRKENRREVSQREEELEEIRMSAQKKVKSLEAQLENEHEERTLLVREKHELERRIVDLQDRTITHVDEDYVHKLKKELKKTKALLRDTQTMLEKAQSEGSHKLILRQLKTQLEDAEFAKTAALKARQCADADLAEVSSQLDEALRSKKEAEDKCARVNKERAETQTQLEESEEEVAEVMKKYKSVVSQLSVDQITLSEQSQQIAELEHSKQVLQERMLELSSKVEVLEGETANIHTQRRLEMKIKEIESKLELELTTRQRLESQIGRLKDQIERISGECDTAKTKESQAIDQTKRLGRQLRDAKEDVSNVQQRFTEAVNKKSEIEKQLELSDAEVVTLKSDLKLAFKRIEDLQQAIQGDISDSDSDLSDSDSDSDGSLSSYLTASLRHQRSSSNSTLRTPPSEVQQLERLELPNSPCSEAMSAISEDLDNASNKESFA